METAKEALFMDAVVVLAASLMDAVLALGGTASVNEKEEVDAVLILVAVMDGEDSKDALDGKAAEDEVADAADGPAAASVAMEEKEAVFMDAVVALELAASLMDVVLALGGTASVNAKEEVDAVLILVVVMDGPATAEAVAMEEAEQGFETGKEALFMDAVVVFAASLMDAVIEEHGVLFFRHFLEDEMPR